MRALEIITGHVICNPAYTYKFQLKTALIAIELSGRRSKVQSRGGMDRSRKMFRYKPNFKFLTVNNINCN